MYEDELHLEGLKNLPKPQGYRVLVALPDVQRKTKSGIYLPDEHLDKEQFASVVGLVIDMGPEAYGDASKFAGPWCAVGDWIMFKAYSGTRFKIGKQQFRLINDDTVEAVVSHPEEIVRA